MKKVMLGFLSLLLAFASIWGVNVRGQRAQRAGIRESGGTSLWV